MYSIRIAFTVALGLVYMGVYSQTLEPVIINTLYGNATITEPVLIELLHSQAFNRLYNINQYGVMKFLKPEQSYTRSQHSIGVLYLLRHFNASLEEQVMGLLHDVSHTAFSHVADFLFDTIQDKYSYQDTIFEWYIEHTDLKEILERYDLGWITALCVRDHFKMLKDDLPNLCADRLEYNLYGGYLENVLTQEDIVLIVNALEYKNEHWVFNDYVAAKMFADVVLYLSTNIWCADWNCYVYSETARLLKHALITHLITNDDLIFSDDATIWNRLHTAASHDALIAEQLTRIMDYQKSFTLATEIEYDYSTRGKFRWIDPLVMTKAGPQPLSSIDRSFKETIEEQKKRFQEPHYIKYATV